MEMHILALDRHTNVAGNQKPQMEEEQTIQWQTETARRTNNDLQNTTQKTKDVHETSTVTIIHILIDRNVLMSFKLYHIISPPPPCPQNNKNKNQQKRVDKMDDSLYLISAATNRTELTTPGKI